jgi:molybdate transport system substrate-binding protein
MTPNIKDLKNNKGLCMKKSFVPGVLLLVFIFFLPLISQSADLTLAIANSTCATMKKAGDIFTEKTNIKLEILCKPSGLLAQGIKEGELEVDYFLSANEKWMNRVVAVGLIDSATIKTNWGNQLVVASLPPKTCELKLQTLEDLIKPEVKQILMGDPTIAPYGMYAKEALINSGLWKKVQPKLKFNRKISLSVRTLKKYGLSRTGIVALLYQTNIKGNLLTHFKVPQHFYTPIKYFSAPLVNSRHKKNLGLFLEFIKSEDANDIFRAAGFIVASN